MKRLRKAILLFAGAAMLAGCASSSYMGVPLTPGAASADLQSLARRARAGDKRAQLELGIIFEEGRGIAADVDRARSLYRMASTDDGGTRMMHAPAIGGRGRPMATPIDRGTKVAGLDEARARLNALDRPGNEAHSSSGSAERSVYGRIRYIGRSDVCATQLAAIQATQRVHISECSAIEYIVTQRNGLTIRVIDLILFTNDRSAMINYEIHFGLLDGIESGLEFYAKRPRARGTISYTEMQADSSILNIVTSFRRGH